MLDMVCLGGWAGAGTKITSQQVLQINYST